MNNSLMKELKNEVSDRAKVLAWLDHIEEFDEACRKEVIEQCAKDPEARKYYVSRFETMKHESI